MTLLADQMQMIDQAAAVELRGTVDEVKGLALRVVDFPVPIGASVIVRSSAGRAKENNTFRGEVVGFDREQTIVMPFGVVSGVRQGDHVIAEHYAQRVPVGQGLLGRVINAFGRPIDGGGAVDDVVPRPLHASPIDPMNRPVIDEPLATGVRAIDALVSVGRGQRLGVFAAPGVGKSTLLGMMAKQTEADVTVIALVGERGREVREFLENTLGQKGRDRSVVVCATGDEPALLRIRAAMVAAATAEYFREQGNDVLFIMDSVTRFCQAQREVGLAAGEPPATKGYPPSVFSTLPRLLERSGRTERGSITGMYAVLVEGDDMDEPISDACRGILDGHIILSRKLAARGHWPAIDVSQSISRVCDEIIDSDHNAARQMILQLINAYHEVEDLVNIGAYAAGSNDIYDLAIACREAIDQLLRQGRGEKSGKGDFASARNLLITLCQQVDAVKHELAKRQRRPAPTPPPRR
jgi:FliI/YscN family ATPase